MPVGARGSEDEPTAAGRGWTTALNLGLLVVGGLALTWMLRATSWPELRDAIRGVGGWAAVIVILDLLALCCDAAALHAFMRPEARMVSYLRVLAAQAGGRAINVVTPLGALGEPAKISLLAGSAPRSRVVSSIVLLNVATLYLNAAVILIGLPITVVFIGLPDPIKLAVGIGLAALIAGTLGLGVMIQRGATASVVDILRSTRLISDARATAWKAKLAGIDRHVRELHSHRTTGTWIGLTWLVISKLLAAITTVLLMSALGVELTPAVVSGVLSVGVLVTWISSVVPLGLGLADTGNYALYTVLGASGQLGMFATMLTRARAVAIAMLGVVAIAAINALNRYAQWQIRRRLARRRLEADAAAAEPRPTTDPTQPPR